MTSYPPIIDLLPHQPPMVLLDGVTDYQAESVTVQVCIHEDTAFFTAPHGVAAHVGLEYMAQACGAYAGLQSREHYEPVRMGFLLGTRHFQAMVDWFAQGSTLTIYATQILRQESLGVFDCRIEHEGETLASAQLTVYQSDKVAGEI